MALYGLWQLLLGLCCDKQGALTTLSRRRQHCFSHDTFAIIQQTDLCSFLEGKTQRVDFNQAEFKRLQELKLWTCTEASS